MYHVSNKIGWLKINQSVVCLAILILLMWHPQVSSPLAGGIDETPGENVAWSSAGMDLLFPCFGIGKRGGKPRILREYSWMIFTSVGGDYSGPFAISWRNYLQKSKTITRWFGGSFFLSIHPYDCELKPQTSRDMLWILDCGIMWIPDMKDSHTPTDQPQVRKQHRLRWCVCVKHLKRCKTSTRFYCRG